jgi:hypothetical protein
MTKEQQDAHKAKMRAKRLASGGNNNNKREGNTWTRAERKDHKKKHKANVAELTSIFEEALNKANPAAAAATTTTGSPNPASQFGAKVSAILTKMVKP